MDKEAARKSLMAGMAVAVLAAGGAVGGAGAAAPVQTRLADLHQVSLSQLGSVQDHVLSRSLDRVLMQAAGRGPRNHTFNS